MIALMVLSLFMGTQELILEEITEEPKVDIKFKTDVKNTCDFIKTLKR